jgi:hypothetical protein
MIFLKITYSCSRNVLQTFFYFKLLGFTSISDLLRVGEVWTAVVRSLAQYISEFQSVSDLGRGGSWFTLGSALSLFLSVLMAPHLSEQITHLANSAEDELRPRESRVKDYLSLLTLKSLAYNKYGKFPSLI